MRQFNRLLLTTTSSLALLGAAAAADMPTKAPPVAPPVAPALSWAGPYLGVNLGAAWNHAEFSDVGNSCCHYVFGSNVPEPFWSTDPAGFTFGGQAGYNLQAGNFVYGIEGDLNWVDAKASATFVPFPGGNVAATTKLEWMASIRGRLGLAFGPALFYGTGGVAWAHFSDAWGFASLGGNTFSSGDTRTAGIFGGGIEYMFAPNWIGRVEALFANFGTKTIAVVPPGTLVGPYASSFEHKVTTVRAALSFKW
jgi:outer membrane immunogenic protein